MLKGYLVYDHENANKNEWFIQNFIKMAKEYSLDVELVFTDEIEEKVLPDFAVVRAISPKTNKYLESKKVKVFNNFLTNLTANDKYRTYKLAKILKIPVMNTVQADDFLEYPYVLKSVDGHGGNGVFMITDDKSYQKATQQLKGKTYIKQALCTDIGKDLRVYALGKKVLAGALRTSEKDFRSNFSLGGQATKIKVPIRCKKVVKKLYKELKFDFVGIDFIFDKGKPVLNEIEDPVGCRMLYSFGLNPIQDLIKHIIKKV